MPAAFRVALAVLALFSAVDLRAQTAPQTRAEALLADTHGDRPPAVDCRQVGQDDVAAFMDLGAKLRGESLERSTAAYRLAADAARCAGSDALVGAALNSLGTLLNLRGLNDEAAVVAHESETIHERLHDEGGLAQAWNIQASIRWGHGDMTGALVQYERALDAWTRAGDKASQARALSNIGNVHRALGSLELALEYQTRALRIFEELGDQYRAAVVTDNIGVTFHARGEYTTALDYSRRALELARAAGQKQIEAKCLDSLANDYRGLGAYQLALQSYAQALELRIAVDDKPGVMETSHNIGLVHYSQGDYELAIAAYKRGLRLNQAVHDRSFDAEALGNIGAAAWRLGQRDRAAANLRAGLAIARSAGLRTNEGELLHELGQVALAQGRHASAGRLFDESLAIRRSTGDQAGITESLTSLAAVRMAGGQPKASLDLAQQAVANALAHDQQELLWRARTTAGIALHRLGRTGDSRRMLADAVDSIERLSAQLTGGDDLRQRFFEDKLSPYHELMALDVDERAYGDALELAERSKARVLAELLHANRTDQSAYLTAAERQEQARLRDAVGRAEHQLADEQSKPAPDGARIRALESARRDAREAQAAFDAEFVGRHPEFAVERGHVAAVTVAEAGRILPAGAATIEYAVADRRLFAFLVTTDGSHASVDARSIDVDSAALAARAEHFRTQIASRDLDVDASARALYELLLGPFANQLASKRRVVIVPDGPLWSVPFQALRGPGGYVIETAAVSYAPSLTVLREIRRLPAPAGAATLLAMGKTTFEGTGRAALEPLPDAEKQVRRLRDIYGAEHSAVYVGSAASEGQFKALAPRYSVLHLATHGILDEASPLYSHLMLSPDHASPDDDGRLEAWEIMRLKLAADVVVLAACDTARGRLTAGEGVVGTMWALMVGGARSMVVSQFRVEATSATELLVAFHRGIAAAGHANAADLRAAALGVLHTPRYAHPYYWAGFIIVGGAE